MKGLMSELGRPYDYAPELLRYGHSTKKSDLYQLGLVLYFLYVGLPALSSLDGPDQIVPLLRLLLRGLIWLPLFY